MNNFLKNYIWTLSCIYLGYFFYTTHNYYSDFLNHTLAFQFIPNFSITTFDIFQAIVVIYTILLVPYYLYFPEKSKARILWWYLKKVVVWRDNSISEKERLSLLSWIVKFFFAPLMVMWLSDHIFSLSNNIYNVWWNSSLIQLDFLSFFNNHFFWFAFSLILFLDVLFFTLWYLLESPLFKNTIRSVEPTIIGWVVALICYPPFNDTLSNIIGWYSQDFPQFENPVIHISMAVFILTLMGVYSWASVSLWLKASNLTNRWIVSKGPYKYVRHPAYICKNLAWWIGWIPFMIATLWSGNIGGFATILFGLSGWTFIYYMRAITEENHLSLDTDYIKYKKQVPYKFLPKIW